MNQRLKFEQAVQFVLSPESESKLSELLDTDDDEEDEIIQFLREKIQGSVIIISICCFSFTVSFTFHCCCFGYFLWCVAPRVEFEIASLIAFVMSFRAGKMWLFYSKFEVSLLFSWAGSSTFLLVSFFFNLKSFLLIKTV